MLYMVYYDEAEEQNMPYATEIHVVYTTCNKEMAKKILEETLAAKRTASIMELPFEKSCDELIAMYYE